MTGRLNVHIAGHGPAADLHRNVLASLPDKWSSTDAIAAAAAVIIDPRHGGWPAPGIGAVVHMQPASLTRADFASVRRELAPDRQVIVPLDLAPRLAADPLMSGLAEGQWRIFESVAQVGDRASLADLLLEQLTAGRLLLGGLTGVTALSRSDSHYVVSARAPGGAAATLSGCVTNAGTRFVSIDLVGPAERIEIEVDLRAIASPATIIRHDATGARRSWPTHQSGLRLVWSSLAEAIASGTSPTWTLAWAEPDLFAVQDVLGPG